LLRVLMPALTQQKSMDIPHTAMTETCHRGYTRRSGLENFAFQICSGVLVGEVLRHPLEMPLRQSLPATQTVSLHFADLHRASMAASVQDEVAARSAASMHLECRMD
jgi:hypothetical protein